MKGIITVLLLLSSCSLVAQNAKSKIIDTSRIYIKFTSKQYKSTIATIYTSGEYIFTQSCFIPSDAFMWYRCDSVRPCRVNVDYAYPDRKPLLVSGEFYNGDSIIVDMDARSTKVINKRK